MTMLAQTSPDAKWLLDALVEDAARTPTPAWASLSAFHLLRRQEPREHPGYGIALLQWQRMSARFGERAPRLAAEAFLALPRAADPSARVPARILELWVRMNSLPVEVAGRLTALDAVPVEEAALIAEELALGAHEGGKPSPGVLALVAAREGEPFAEARALASLERFASRQIDADALAHVLAPGLFGEPSVALPAVTARLLGGLHHPVAFVPEDLAGLHPVLARIRLAAAELPATSTAASLAQRILACSYTLGAADVLALSQPGRAAHASTTARLPTAADLKPLIAAVTEAHAVQVALSFPALAGAVEVGRALPGLTAWRAAREPDAAPRPAIRALEGIPEPTRARWNAFAEGELSPAVPTLTLRERLTESLRSGSALNRDELLAARDVDAPIAGLLFASPGGPGLLRPDGQLENALRRWPAPETLAVAHPVEFYDAERTAWQLRLQTAGLRSPLNQIYREVYRAGGRELQRKRIERLRGTLLGPASLALLARRGWFPTLAPAEVSPELVLGAYRARLRAEPSPAGPLSLGVEILKDGVALELPQVPPRIFSEAWRDMDEALSLSLTSGSFVPSVARAELVRVLAEQLGLVELRIESDHVAFAVGTHPERITLHNARPADGELVPSDVARARAAEVLPFDDDGGLAALLVGRILCRARPDPHPAAQPAPREGT
jgi:hypothetical protein